MEQILIQAIGVMAFAILWLSFQFDDRKVLVNLRSFHNIVYGIHFYFLNALTASALQIMAVARNFVFLNRTKHKAFNGKIWLFIFLILFLITGIITWEGPVSILSFFGMGLGTLSIWSEKTQHIRLFTLLSTFFWLIHNFIIVSFAGIFFSIITIISLSVAMLRFKRKISSVQI